MIITTVLADGVVVGRIMKGSSRTAGKAVAMDTRFLAP
jgi:hypothetical protein